MIPPEDYLRTIIDPGCRLLTNLMGQSMGDDRARVLLLAIGKQESNLEHRLQLGSDGQPMEQYARGFSQFEKGGGVHGVMTHSASKDAAAMVCIRLQIPFDEDRVHTAIAYNDYLSITFARLLLWTDAAPLPAVGDEEGAWNLYSRVWRPGRPHPETWPANYRLAVATVAAATAPPPGTA